MRLVILVVFFILLFILLNLFFKLFVKFFNIFFIWLEDKSFLMSVFFLNWFLVLIIFLSLGLGLERWMIGMFRYESRKVV